jgi:hypothetical protein
MAETKELGRITDTSLGMEDHGIFTFMIMLDFGGKGQGYGGYCLDDRKWVGVTRGTGAGAIITLLESVGVSNWEDLKGKPVWAYRDDPFGSITAIEAPDFIHHEGRCNLKEYFAEAS